MTLTKEFIKKLRATHRELEASVEKYQTLLQERDTLKAENERLKKCAGSGGFLSVDIKEALQNNFKNIKEMLRPCKDDACIASSYESLSEKKDVTSEGKDEN